MKIAQFLRRLTTKDMRPYPANTFPPERKAPRRSRLIIVLLFALATSLGAGGYYFFKYRELHKSLLSTASQAEVKELQEKISRLMVPPSTALPTVATISDYSKIKDQPFFAKSGNGDKLLIYPDVKMAVLYSPKLDKIINVGPLTLEDKADKAAKP